MSLTFINSLKIILKVFQMPHVTDFEILYKTPFQKIMSRK